MFLLKTILLLIASSEAFYTSAGFRRPTRHQLFVDENNGGAGGPKAKNNNEWGIPDSKTLEPFRSHPTAQLDNGGKITLVGSGPGDPELLTLSAYKLLQDPEALVICDRLVSSEIVDLIQGEVKVARKLPGCAELAQEEIFWWAHQGLKQGRHVIRLKIGDPFVFGRGGEEVITFRRFGVESKIVPVRTLSLVIKKRRRQQINLYHFFPGCLGSFFGSFAWKYSCHSSRCCKPSGNVYGLWT